MWETKGIENDLVGVTSFNNGPYQNLLPEFCKFMSKMNADIKLAGIIRELTFEVALFRVTFHQAVTHVISSK